jgi:hypothetical protein
MKGAAKGKREHAWEGGILCWKEKGPRKSDQQGEGRELEGGDTTVNP